MPKSYGGIKVQAAIVSMIVMILLFAQFTPPILSQPAFASSCAIEMSPAEVTTDYSSTVSQSMVDQEFIVLATSKNCTSHPISFIGLIEVRSSQGIIENIGWASADMPPNGQAKVGISWTPAYGDRYEIRSFAISDFVSPVVLSNVSTTFVEIAERNTENLTLQFHVSKTDLLPQEAFATSYYLVNNGNHTVSLAVEGYFGNYESLNYGSSSQRLG